MQEGYAGVGNLLLTQLCPCQCKIISPILPGELMTDQRRLLMDEQNASGAGGITFRQIEQMGVDEKGRLTWKGDLVQVQKRVTLSVWQRIAAAAVVLGATSQGVLAAYQFGCAMAFWTKGCLR